MDFINNEIAQQGMKEAEISKDEWENRQLTPYGKAAGIFDIVFVFACLAATWFIRLAAITAEPTIGAALLALMVVVFILMLKGIIRILFARDSYQTVIVRQI